MNPTPRFLSHNDGCFLLYCPAPISEEEFIHQTVGRVAGTQVDTVVCQMFGFGDNTPLFQSTVPEAQGIPRNQFDHVSEWRQQHSLEQLWARGVDPWLSVIRRAHELGLAYYASMRFNDIHPPRFQWPTHFRVNHPEYLLGARCPSPVHKPGDKFGGVCHGYDFSREEVQQHCLALIEEVCNRYDIDGFDLDMMRFPGHSFADIEQARTILNDYISRVAECIRAVNRKIQFGLRVPDTVEACEALGYDVRAWVACGAVDYLTPSRMRDTRCDVSFQPFVELTRESNCRVYACPSEYFGPGRDQVPTPDVLRAVAANAWADGVDGYYLYNYHQSRNYDHREILGQLGDPITLTLRDKVYVMGKPAPGKAHVSDDYVIPTRLFEGDRIEVQLPVADDLNNAQRRGWLKSASLILDVTALTSSDEFDLSLGSHTFDQPHRRLGPTGIQGNQRLVYDLSDDQIRRGCNQISLTLRRRNAELNVPLSVDRLELDVKFHNTPIRS